MKSYDKSALLSRDTAELYCIALNNALKETPGLHGERADSKARQKRYKINLEYFIVPKDKMLKH